MARRRVRGMVTVVGGVVATLVAGLLTASPANAAPGPVITSISVSTNAVTAPGEVVLSYTATASAPLTQALAGYKDPAGRLYSVNLSAGTSGTGTRKIPDGVQNGSWKLQYLYLAYSATVFTYACNPAYASTNAKCTETRDLSANDVVVSGSTEDFEAPVLTSVSITPSSVSPGAPLTVNLGATDLHAIRASLTWKHAVRESAVSVASTGPVDPAKGSFTVPVPQSVYNGDYHLLRVILTDANGFTAQYGVDGNVYYSATPGTFYPQPSRSPGTHTVPFAPAALQVKGSTQDWEAPVITSLALTTRNPSAGQPAELHFAATERQGGVASMDSTWVIEQTGATWGPHIRENLSLEDTLYVPTSRSATYRLSSIRIKDSLGNTATYSRDGTVALADGSTATHSLDFPSLDFTAKPVTPQLFVRNRPAAADLSVYLGMWDSGITGVRVVVSPGGRVIDLPARDQSDSLETRVTGLRNGVKYTFTVAAQSAVGAGGSAKVAANPMISGNIWAAGDVNGDRRTDLFAKVQGGELRLYRSAGYPKFKAPTKVLDPAETHSYPSGAIGGQTAFLSVYSGYLFGNIVDRDGKFVGQVRNGSGWGSMRSIDGSADFTGDGKADIVAITSTGAMRIYRGDGNGRFTAPTQVGTGWSPMLRVFVPGDVTGDRRADVMAVDSAGVLWIYPGNGRGGFTTKKRVGSGWGGMGAVFAARDLNGDGRADLGAVTMDGKLRLYPGRGNGSFASPATIGSGWNTFF